MSRFSSAGAGRGAIAVSVVLHLGVAVGFASPRSGERSVEIEVSSLLQANDTSVSPSVSPSVANATSAPTPDLAPPPPASRAVPLARAPRAVPVRSPSHPAASSTPAPPRFDISGQAATGSQARFVLPSIGVALATRPPAPAIDGAEATLAEAVVDVPARLIASSPLRYPARARSAQVEASVPLEIIVDARGRVVAQRVLAAAGYGLDEAALSAIRGYRFTPAQRSGQPVCVRMRWSVVFELH